MNIGLDRVEMNLEAGQILRLHDAAGASIACVRGALWITQYRDREDHFLAAGDALTLNRPGLALVHAQARSALVLREPAPRASPRQRIAGTAASALRAAGRWAALNFGPQALDRSPLGRWHGAL